MDILQLSRELGKAIQADERYKNYHAALDKTNEDEELQNLIKEFNLKKMAYEYAYQKDKDSEKLKGLEEEVNELYNKVISSQSMLDYNAAKSEMDALMNGIQSVLSQCAAGEDADTCQPKNACTGDCASCGGGCH